MQLQLPASNASHVEQVVYQAGFQLRVPSNHSETFSKRRRVELFLIQSGIKPEQNRTERRAQLVTEHGQESVLCLVRRLGRRLLFTHLSQSIRQLCVQCADAPLLFFQILLGRFSDDIVHCLMDDSFVSSSSLSSELGLFASKRFYPVIKENPADNARLAYDFLQPVALTPANPAVASRSVKNLPAHFLRLRRL